MVSFLKQVIKSNGYPAFLPRLSFIKTFVDDMLIPDYPDLFTFMNVKRDDVSKLVEDVSKCHEALVDVSTVLQPHTTYCCVCNPLRPSQLHQILLPKAEMLLGCISSCVTQKMPRQSPEFPKPLLQNWHKVLYRLWACQVAFWNTIGPI